MKGGETFKQHLKTGVKKILYTDMYLYSPFNAIILRQLMEYLKPQELIIKTMFNKKERRTLKSSIMGQWSEQHYQEWNMAKILDIPQKHIEYVKNNKDKEHKRTMMLHLNNGITYEITLEKGVDIFKYDKKYNPKYTFSTKLNSDSELQQVKKILASNQLMIKINDEYNTTGHTTVELYQI